MGREAIAFLFLDSARHHFAKAKTLIEEAWRWNGELRSPEVEEAFKRIEVYLSQSYKGGDEHEGP